MAFSESTAAANRNAFIVAFINFAVANAGFTNEGTTIDGSRTIYHISKGGLFWNFVEDEFNQGSPVNTTYNISCKMSYAKITTEVEMEGSSSNGQQYATRMANYHVGPYAGYFLYTDGNAVHCVLQNYVGVYSHLSFGNITKFGTWFNGGEYLTANGAHRNSSGVYTDWDYQRQNIYFDAGNQDIYSFQIGASYMRISYGAYSNDYTDFGPFGRAYSGNKKIRGAIATSPVETNDGIITDMVSLCGTIGYNVRTPLFPMWMRDQDVSTTRHRVIGYVPYMKALNVQFLAEAQIVDNDWIVFPVIQKQSGDDTLSPLSDYWGVAYKRVA